MVAVAVSSSEIRAATVHRRIPLYLHLYASPFVVVWSIFVYAYLVKYEEWFGAEEWAFLAGAIITACHALSFLTTQWSTGVKAAITCMNVRIFFSCRYRTSAKLEARLRHSKPRTAFASFRPSTEGRAPSFH